MRARTLILVAAAAGLAVAFAALGQWQLNRASEREALEQQFASLAVAPPLEVLPDTDAAGDLRYRRVILHGRYSPEMQVLLDNMTHEGVAGYHVLTPFVFSGGAVVVNRGFVPVLSTRNELPEIGVSAEERTLRGRIDTLPAPALRLTAEDGDSASAVQVLSFPDAKDLERALGRPVAAYQILLDSGEADGFVRAWEARGISAERNLAYAGQWFALAAATLIAALGLLRKSLVQRRNGA